MRPIPTAAPTFLRKHEGCVLRVYDDARPRLILQPGAKPVGTLTGGYGHTGPELTPGLEVTQGLADAWLMEDLRTAAERLERRIGAVVGELTGNQYAALLSFVFNLGVDGKMAGATIWKRLKARQFDQIPLEMMKFVNAGGKKLQGLVNRRAAEVALWSTFEPGSISDTPPSSLVRLMDTPPTPADPVPMHRSASILTGFAAAIASGPAIVNQAIEAVQPYSVFSPQVTTIMGVLGAIGAAIAVAKLVIDWRKKREARS